METITTDIIIQGPATHGRTGETYYEAWLPLRSPAQEYIKGTPVGSGPTPYAAMGRARDVGGRGGREAPRRRCA